MNKLNNLLLSKLSHDRKIIWSDIAEMSIDKTLEFIAKDQEVLKEIPIVKWVVTSLNMHNSIQNAKFLKKYANFIGQVQLANFTETDLLLLEETTEKPYITDEIIENTMVYIDRYHNELKAKLLGKLFVQTFKHNNFSTAEYNSLMFSIEQIHPFDGISKLKEFYNYRLQFDGATTDEEKQRVWSDNSDIDYHSLAMSGLLTLPTGGSYTGDFGGAYINEKGFKFYKLVVL